MDFIIKYWYLLVAGIALLAFVIAKIVKFCKEPSAEQVANLKQWLKWAVAEAEKALGSGTGQLKLRMVYDMAIAKFPWLLKIVSFEQFSVWVDEALIWLNKELQANGPITTYITSA